MTRRAELGLTQEQLAERIGGGVRQAEVSPLERDRVVLPRPQCLAAIAAALEMPVGELLERSGWTGAGQAIAIPSPPPAEASPPARTESSTYRRPVESPLMKRFRAAVERGLVTGSA